MSKAPLVPQRDGLTRPVRVVVSGPNPAQAQAAAIELENIRGVVRQFYRAQTNATMLSGLAQRTVTRDIGMLAVQYSVNNGQEQLTITPRVELPVGGDEERGNDSWDWALVEFEVLDAQTVESLTKIAFFAHIRSTSQAVVDAHQDTMTHPLADRPEPVIGSAVRFPAGEDYEAIEVTVDEDATSYTASLRVDLRGYRGATEVAISVYAGLEAASETEEEVLVGYRNPGATVTAGPQIVVGTGTASNVTTATNTVFDLEANSTASPKPSTFWGGPQSEELGPCEANFLSVGFADDYDRSVDLADMPAPPYQGPIYTTKATSPNDFWRTVDTAYHTPSGLVQTVTETIFRGRRVTLLGGGLWTTEYTRQIVTYDVVVAERYETITTTTPLAATLVCQPRGTMLRSADLTTFEWNETSGLAQPWLTWESARLYPERYPLRDLTQFDIASPPSLEIDLAAANRGLELVGVIRCNLEFGTLVFVPAEEL